MSISISKNFQTIRTLSTFLCVLFVFTFSNTYSSCSSSSFIEGADRTYVNGDIISRNGKDYQVVVAGWANSSASDSWYAPGTGSAWNSFLILSFLPA